MTCVLQSRLARRLSWVLRWTVAALGIGALAGLCSAAFIEALQWSTDTREGNDMLLWFLPLAGLGVGLTYHCVARGLERGSNLVIEQLHGHTENIPFRLAPVVFVCSMVSHLFGASVGREGAAVQIAAGVTDPVARFLRLHDRDRRLILTAAVAGGFGSVFGVPVAGAIFALEVRRIGRIDYAALVPALTASVVGDAVVRGLGVEHSLYPRFGGPGSLADWSWPVAWRLAVVGVACGFAAIVFVGATRLVRRTQAHLVSWPPLRPAAGGVVIVVLTVALSWREYGGLSIGLATEAMGGGDVAAWLPKLLLSAVAIGSGFVGGEVIPLVVIGALLGGSTGELVGLDGSLASQTGAVALLGAAGNVPLACVVMGVELFGSTSAVMVAVPCIVAYVASGHSTIYHAQRVATRASGMH